MIDAFSTNVLARTVAKILNPPSFLLDTFFPLVQTEDSSEIHFDVDQSKPRITPFVSPKRAGIVVDNEGYETKTFRPAYAKDKREFDPNTPLRRRMGEQIGGDMTPMQRRNAAIGQTLENQLDMLTRREEVMAAEALRNGQVTVTGEGYPTVVVDFQRDPSLSVTLSGASRWGQAGVKVFDNIEDWSDTIQLLSGVAGTTVVMDMLAWRLARQDADFLAMLDTRRGSNSTAEIGPIARDQRRKARYVGNAGDFDIWVYNDTYVDEAGVTQKLLPDYTVLMGSPTDVEGTRCYATIRDEKANYEARRFFVKSWLEEDPAVRWMLLQSAPLVVPYRVNATFRATVN